MNWLVASLVGAATGLVASMGLGGGFVLLVYLALFTDLEQKTAQGVNLLFFIPIIVIAVILHLKNRLIDCKTALLCGALGALTVPLGYLLAGAVGGDWLRKAFAVFVIAAGLKDLFSKAHEKGVDKNRKQQ